MQPYPLINFEMQKYYQNEPIFNVEEKIIKKRMGHT